MCVIESCQKIEYNALFMMILIPVSNFGDQSLGQTTYLPLLTFVDIWTTTYLPLLVNVVCERPLIALVYFFTNLNDDCSQLSFEVYIVFVAQKLPQQPQ